jgi:hypothetical protein
MFLLPVFETFISPKIVKRNGWPGTASSRPVLFFAFCIRLKNRAFTGLMIIAIILPTSAVIVDAAKCRYDRDRGSFRVLDGGKAPSLFEKAKLDRHHGEAMEL